MKRLIFITVLIACVMAMYLQAEFSSVYDYTWKTHKQTKVSTCCGCSDSQPVYFVVEFIIKSDYKVYNKTGTQQIGTWNDSEGPLSGRIYFNPAINGVSYFDFSYVENSLFLIGGNSDAGYNVFCVRNTRI